MIRELTVAASALTALLGAYVAVLADRGARQNDSATMRLLAVGIVCIAVVPYLLTYVAAPLLALSDARTILGVTVAHALGLAAIHLSFDS